jgi:DNA-directed RNA polymerase specialized sigma24 family protein
MQQQPEGTVKSRVRAGLRRMEQELARLAQGAQR